MAKSRSNFGWSSSVRDKSIDYSPYGFLIVDDEPGIKEIVSDVLRTCRAKHLVQAENGEEAIGHLTVDPKRFDVIISDCNMSPVNACSYCGPFGKARLKGWILICL